SARRIHFLAPQHIGGTHGQTKSAMDALFNDLVRRRMVRVENGCVVRVGCHFIHRKSGSAAAALQELYIPPTNRPGFSVFLGSSCCFTAFINASASPAIPQASNAGILSGRWSTTREPCWPCNSPRSVRSAPRSEPALPSRRSPPRPVAYISAFHRS